MKTDLAVILENRPGTLADLGEALGKAGINIEGVCGGGSGKEAYVHILVEDGAAAQRVLEAAGFVVRDPREMLLVAIEDKPGEMGRLARKLANAGVNIELGYLATGGQLALGIDDLQKARSVL